MCGVLEDGCFCSVHLRIIFMVRLQISVLINGDFGLGADRTKLDNQSEEIVNQPGFLDKLAKVLSNAKKHQYEDSTFGKLMKRIDRDHRASNSAQIAARQTWVPSESSWSGGLRVSCSALSSCQCQLSKAAGVRSSRLWERCHLPLMQPTGAIFRGIDGIACKQGLMTLPVDMPWLTVKLLS